MHKNWKRERDKQGGKEMERRRKNREKRNDSKSDRRSDREREIKTVQWRKRPSEKCYFH